MWHNRSYLLFLVAVLGVGSVLHAAPGGTIDFEIINRYPHDPEAFTQGLVYENGILYEGTGLEGESTLREVDLKSGKAKRLHHLEDRYFGEGLALFKGELFQLTWMHSRGFVYGAKDFKPAREFTYKGEGWGLTQDGEHLIMSNGSNVLTFRDPEYFQIVRELPVFLKKMPVRNLNELEYVNGSIYANVWKTNSIVRINPDNGEVTGFLDCAQLECEALDKSGDKDMDVLNGIAWKEDSQTLLVTGKLWPILFEIKLKEIQ